MANIIFSESSGINDPVFGKYDTPIKAMIMDYAEPFQSEPVLNSLFAMVDSTHFAEAYSSMTAMEDWAPVGENGKPKVNGFQTGYTKNIQNLEWKSMFSISKTIIEDTNISELKSRPRKFVNAFYRTRENLGAAMYGGALSGKKTIQIAVGGGNYQNVDITGADGEALFSTAHKSFTGKGKNQSNMFKDAVSNDAIMAMETAMQEFKDEDGNRVDVRPDTIVIPNVYTLKKSVFEAIGADKDPSTANNGFNYNFGRWNIIVWGALNDFITEGSAPWMMVDSKFIQDYFAAVFQDRTDMAIRSEIASNDAMNYYGRARFGAGFTNFRFAAVGGMSSGTQLIG
jgi:hypothetical protein